MTIAQNCIIAHAALCEGLSIWWRPILNCAVYRYCNFNGNNMICFKSLTQASSYILSTSFAHFGMTFASFWFSIPRIKPNKNSTDASVYKASHWRWRCQRGWGNIYIFTRFFSAFSFWKFQLKLYWVFHCDFWIWPLCTFTDRIS